MVSINAHTNNDGCSSSRADAQVDSTGSLKDERDLRYFSPAGMCTLGVSMTGCWDIVRFTAAGADSPLNSIRHANYADTGREWPR